MTHNHKSDVSFAHATFHRAAHRHAARALLARDECFQLDECWRTRESARIAIRAAHEACEAHDVAHVIVLARDISDTILARRFGG